MANNFYEQITTNPTLIKEDYAQSETIFPQNVNEWMRVINLLVKLTNGTQKATQSQAEQGSDDTAIMTAVKVRNAIDILKGKASGLADLDSNAKLKSVLYDFASQLEVEQGLNTEKPVNALGVRQAIQNAESNYNYAPKPVISTGLGQWANLVGTSTLPDGGMWAYFIFQTNSGGGLQGDGNNYSGIAAGGEKIVGGTQAWCHGFAWRIA